MTRVVTNMVPLLTHTTRAFVEAAGDTLLDAQDMAPRGKAPDPHSGQYAASLKVLELGPGTPLRGRQASSVPRVGGIGQEEGTKAGVVLSIPADGGHMVAVIGSELPYAGAVERGAWVKGRGPHMRGKTGRLAEACGHFFQHWIDRLRSAP